MKTARPRAIFTFGLLFWTLMAFASTNHKNKVADAFGHLYFCTKAEPVGQTLTTSPDFNKNIAGISSQMANYLETTNSWSAPR